MNLIEKSGLEKARAIVEGAPRGAEKWRDMDSVCHPNEILYYAKGPHFWVVWDVEENCWVVSIIHDGDEYILDQLQDLSDLRTAIANHHQQSNKSSNFKVGDWVEPVAKGSGFRAMELTAVYDSHMEAGHLQLNYGHWKKVDEHTDCTDIRNHISPLTGVIER